MSVTSFFDDEFSNINLNDTRLNSRAINIGNSLVQYPGSCIQKVMPSKNQARCAYDFFSNPKVDWISLIEPHKQKTKKRIVESEGDFIYVIQDSTFYNYTDHKAKIDLGVIGKQGSFSQFGFLQHTAICVNSNDLPLGILEIDFMGYDDGEEYNSHRKGFEKIASSRWRRFLSSNIEQLKDVGTNKEIILLCDREADFFEFHNDLNSSVFKFVIRCKYDRYTGKSARTRLNRISQLMEAQAELGTIALKITDSNTHEEYESIFYLKALSEVLIPPVHRGAGHPQNKLAPIKMNVVEANDGKNKWVLLTNLPVKRLQDIIFIVESYKKRWHIESFHKVLKTAYNADKVYLHSSRSAIQNLLTIINIAASKTYSFIHQARAGGDLLSNQFFSLEEIEAVSIFLSRKLIENKEVPNLQDFYYQIAELGGYKNKTNKHPPGILTIYRGIQKLQNITDMYKAMVSIKT